MYSPEITNAKNKLVKCFKYKDYETAAFISSYLSCSIPEFQLLTGIILYENQEYSRSLSHLINLHETTAIFYRALNYKKLKKYNEAISEITSIIEGKTVSENGTDSFLANFILDRKDTEFLDSFLGTLLILKGKAKQGIEKYRKSMFKEPLLTPCFGLFDENVWIAPISQFSTDYYSLSGMPKESTTCLMKSLSIQENPFAYSLLGFEFNIRNQYLEAQYYFKSSLCMLENNDKANFGLGVSYGETSKKTTAEVYFKKALIINPSNLSMKAFLVRFYVKNDEKIKAIEKTKEYLNLHCNTLEEMAQCIYQSMGHYNEMEELIICEFIEILVKEKCKELAEKLLQCVQLRTSTYYSKKNLVECGKA